MLADFRHAWRQLCKTPGFTLTAVITLALMLSAATLTLGLAVLAAAVIPTRRAACIDPMQALRSQ